MGRSYAEISQALDSLLEELRSSENARSMRTCTAVPSARFPRQSTNRQRSTSQRPQTASTKVCPICKQVGRQDYEHLLSECLFLPDKDRRFILRARQVVNIFDNVDDEDISTDFSACDDQITHVKR